MSNPFFKNHGPLKLSEIANSLKHTVEQAQHSQEGIGLKFSQLGRRTEFGREQIQQSIISAGEQDAADRNRITMDKYQQDLQAAQLMTSVPTVQPAESLPLQIPETVFTDPQKPTPNIILYNLYFYLKSLLMSQF